MRILVSNDDGVLAPGIQLLARELATIAHVEVMAPDRNRSGSSNSLTLTHPIRVKQLEGGYFSVDGTPTDCVHLGVTGFLNPAPDMVISGINEGGNLGDDIHYSGTVAAAMEGRNLGLPAMAVSMVGDAIQHYETGVAITKNLLLKLQKHPLPQTVFNINIPDLPLNEIRGMQVTRLGKRHRAQPMIKENDPRGRGVLYWVGAPGFEADAGPGTDFHAISQGYVSVTPLHIDMTHYKVFDQVSTWMGTMTEENL